MLQVNEFTVTFMQPVLAADRTVVRVTCDQGTVMLLVAILAMESVEFTFDPMPDDEYEVTVKADQQNVLRRIIEKVR